jgi:uncharacterized protein (TIGR02757 family)
MAGWTDKEKRKDLRDFLEIKADQYNQRSFIATDPIQVPHMFTEPEDIEISGFLTATIAWGRKASIIQSARRLLSMMPGGPYHFLADAEEKDLESFLPFVHRTFNGLDCIYFLRSLGYLYRERGGLKGIFQEGYQRYGDMGEAIMHFRNAFFSIGEPGHTAKHVSDVHKNSAAKRLNLFLRWMIRKDARGVDFGLWEEIPMHALYIPLDVHSASVARKLGLLTRKQNDWKAVQELTARLRELDPEDPVRYDYALFGLGSFEGF